MRSTGCPRGSLATKLSRDWTRSTCWQGISRSGFTLTSGAGTCGPTITSFTPTCGVAGDVFKVTGTNLLAAGDGTGGKVEFSPFIGTPPVGLTASPTNPDISSPTTLQVTVPTGVADGPIRVTTFAATSGGQVFSTALFQTPPPDCIPPGPTTHSRSVTLRLSDSLNAAGNVKVSDGFTACLSAVAVKIQHKVSGSWKTVRSATTTSTGKYAGHLKNKSGKYRALAPKLTINSGADVCSKATSPVRTHS